MISEASCNVRSAQIQWRSSFNGGDIQTFIALAMTAQQEVSRSELLCDKGESKIHVTQLQNLQPSTKYAFYIVAQNKHGNTSSEIIECKTFDDGMLHFNETKYPEYIKFPDLTSSNIGMRMFSTF